MFRSTLVCSAVCACLASSVTAQSFQAQNRLNVVPLGVTSFEVIEARGEGARGIWCAAADFALNRLGQSGRLYVKSPRGPSVSGAGRLGVVFTTRESALSVAPRRSYSVSVTSVGLGLPIHHALQFCKDYLIELEDVLYRRKGN